jgi:hypothetical protein
MIYLLQVFKLVKKSMINGKRSYKLLNSFYTQYLLMMRSSKIIMSGYKSFNNGVVSAVDARHFSFKAKN